jgi:hypothetical protein
MTHQVNVQQPDGTSGTGAGWLPSAGYTVRRLQPEQHYCFRFWSRYVDNDVRSERPSNWVCADTTWFLQCACAAGTPLLFGGTSPIHWAVRYLPEVVPRSPLTRISNLVDPRIPRLAKQWGNWI